MLSIGKVRSAAYHIDQATRDYHFSGGEPPGEWWGGGAASQGLKGEVIRRHYFSVLTGFSPTGKKLRKNAGSKFTKKNRPGFDLALTPPKSFSILWALAPRRIRKAYERCVRRAAIRVLRYIEEELAFIRKGKGGREWVRAKIIAAMFQHGTSRLNDPNLHIHIVVANIGIAGGDSGALDAQYFYRSKMLLGAIFRIELAYFVRRAIRVSFRRVGKWLEVLGIPKRIINHFSKRRDEVLAEQTRTGNSGPRSAEAAVKATRKPKIHRPRHELFREWRAASKKLGLAPREIVARFGREPIADPDSISVETSLDGKAERLNRSIKKAIKRLTAKKSHFREQDILRQLVMKAQSLGLSTDQVIGTIRRYLSASPDVIPLGVYEGEMRYATERTIDLETQILSTVDELKAQEPLRIKDAVREEVLAEGPDLSDEQWRAYEYLTRGPGRIKIISGVPGAGKTRILELYRQACERSGIKVWGAAVAGRAARNLEEATGIESHSLEKTYRLLNATTAWHHIWHHYQQLKRLAAGKFTHAMSRLKLSRRSVLAIDEAGMVDTEFMAWLLPRVREAEATLLLVLDRDQAPPIGLGAPCAAIEDRVGGVKLEITRRFRRFEDVEALASLRAGDPQAALDNYDKRGLLHVSGTRDESIKALLQQWKADGGVENPEAHPILASTNEDCRRINRQAQEMRREEGKYTSEGFCHRGVHFAAGERVLFEQNAKLPAANRIPLVKNRRSFDVCNGDFGTVVATEEDGKWLTVKLRKGETVRFSLHQYDQVSPGYALTVLKFQGSEAEHVSWLADTNLLCRQYGMTAISRHKESLRIFADREDAGEKLEGLVAALKESGRELLATEILELHHAAKEEERTLPPRPLLDIDAEKLPPSVEQALAKLDETLRARNETIRQELEHLAKVDEERRLDHTRRIRLGGQHHAI